MQLFAEMCQVIESESGRIAKKQLFKHYLMEFPEKSRIKVLQIFLGEINPHIGRKSINIKQSALFTREYTIDEIYNTIQQLTNSFTNNERILVDLFGSIPANQLPYLKKILLGNINIGMGETLILEALSELYNEDIKSRYYTCSNIAHALSNNIVIQPLSPIRPALAKASTRIPDEYAVEYKYDGFRFQFHKVEDEWQIYSRKLEDYTYRLQKVGGLLNELPDNIIIDGELITPNMRFQDAIRIDAELTPVIFDILYLDKPVLQRPYVERREILESLDTPYINQIWYNESPQPIFNDALNNGYEGIMIKDLNAPYQPVTRNWIKIKPGQDTVDLVVTGAENGFGKREGVYGSLICGCLFNGIITDICKVGTGFSDIELQRWKYLLNVDSPTPTSTGIRVEPKYVIEVSHSGFQDSPNYTTGKSLRFPVFKCQRPDKPITDILSLWS